MVGTVLSFFMSRWNVGVMAVVVLIILAVGWKFYRDYTNLQEEYQEVTSQLQMAKAQLKSAQLKIAALESEINLKTKESQDINTLLGKCYQRVAAHLTDFKEIEDIMDLEDPTAETTDDLVNPKTHEAGMDFINRQFGRVR